MKQFPLLVFDWDGTLIDSFERIVTSMQFASRQVAGLDISHSQAKAVIGLGLKEAIAMLHPELVANLQTGILDNIADTYRQHYLFDNTIPEPPFEGVNELLDELCQQGYTLAVATGKSRKGLQRSLAQHNMSDYFAATRCAGENKSKPHPEMLYGILEELRFSHNDALMIGDSEYDLQMAKNAGMECIGVTQGAHNSCSLEKYNPLVCLKNIADLSRFLTHNTV